MPRPVDVPSPSPHHPSLEVSDRDCGDGVCVVTPVGEIDLATAPMLKSRLVGMLSEGFSRVVIDLADLRYVDSTGLGVLIAFERRLPEGGVIALAQAPSCVSALLEITGLDATFNVFATVDQALAHIQNAGDTPPVELAPSPDAAIVIGLAATALPFAESAGDELRSWMRILSLQGEAGRALQRVGVTDADVGSRRTQPATPLAPRLTRRPSAGSRRRPRPSRAIARPTA